ncbi:MAG TPA: 50S ribosomal protein L32 [Candidatus Magasanikbacteria bacterium]|nr:50S ribosomal protein L32 [Candidatus Magasanikbacteria bacterium]
MANPSKKLSKQSARTRAAHFALHAPTLATCSQCGAARRTHTACPSCGSYRGKRTSAKKV